MCVSGQFQQTNEHIEILINVEAESNLHLNNTPLSIHGLACLASRLYDMQVRDTAERNFSELKTDAKTEKIKEINKLRCLAALKVRLKGVRNRTSGRKSLL